MPIILNRGLLHDPSTYPEPDVFSPERYLTRLTDGSWKLRTDVIDPRTYAFGFGRRACPGTHLAEQSLFAILSSALHTFDIARAKDGDGNEVVPEARMNSGLLCHPVPFAYELRMREDAEKLMEMCIAAAEQDVQ
jgi:cytochrome P450